MDTFKAKTGWFFRLLVCLGIILMCVAVIPGCDDDDDDDDDDEKSQVTTQLTEKEKSYLSGSEVDEADNLTSRELVSEGFTALDARTSQGVLKAKAYFKMADIKDSDNPTKFLRAVSGVAALGFDLETDGNAGELNDIGDVVEALGGTTVTGAWADLDIILPDELPDTTPSVREFLDFYDEVVVSETETALSLLDDITPSFDYTWTDPVSGDEVESDYGDVLFGKAILKANLGFYYTLKAYNLELEYTDVESLANNQTTIEAFLSANESFLTLASQSSMDSARDNILGAADDLLEAIEFMEMETDNQADDLICLCDVTSEEILEAKAVINQVKNSIQNGQIIKLEDEDQGVDISSEIVLQPFFEGLNLRGLLPDFAGNEPVGFLPDPTFGGILETIEGMDPVRLNDDADGSGTADIFE
jgi:hypothetical protein